MMEPFLMLTALILVCSLASVPDLGDCTRDNALDVLQVPATFESPVTCFMHGQAYVGPTPRSDGILPRTKPSRWSACAAPATGSTTPSAARDASSRYAAGMGTLALAPAATATRGGRRLRPAGE
jgi:hypothetical protein